MDDREVIARAIAEATQTQWREGIIRLGGGDYDTDQLNNYFRHKADAVLAALEASGRVIVPVEQARLLEEYWDASRLYLYDKPATRREWVVDRFMPRIEAMIAAAKEPTDGR